MTTTQSGTGFTVLDPVGEVKQSSLRLNPRVADLNGKVVGVLHNGGARGSGEQLQRLAQLFKQEYKLADLIYRVKPNLSKMAPKETFDELVEKCDVVVVGTAL
ncbi:MAG: hypothetical protein HYX92_11795 [Chloroflexi bacterium]|nr:hypothetical protein [Chloroflexota bacterium]